jgi:hypothetical protein
VLYSTVNRNTQEFTMRSIFLVLATVIALCMGCTGCALEQTPSETTDVEVGVANGVLQNAVLAGDLGEVVVNGAAETSVDVVPDTGLTVLQVSRSESLGTGMMILQASIDKPFEDFEPGVYVFDNSVRDGSGEPTYPSVLLCSGPSVGDIDFDAHATAVALVVMSIPGGKRFEIAAVNENRTTGVRTTGTTSFEILAN